MLTRFPMAQVIDKVIQLVKTHRVAVFAKSYCPHCNATKASLKEAGIKFHNEDIDKWSPADMNSAQDYFQETTGARSVPRIYIEGKCIGGNSDFQANFVKTGKVRELGAM